MNKKVEKALGKALTASLAVSMVAGVSANAATASQADILYKAAYNAVVKAKTERTQKAINEAREAIKALQGTGAAWAIGEFSKQVDTVQGPKFKAIVDGIAKAKASGKQADIDAVRALIEPELPAVYKNSYSSAVDAVQNALIAKVDAAVKKAIETQTVTDIEAATALVNEVKSSTNANIKAWAVLIEKKLVEGTAKFKVLSAKALSATKLEVKFNKEVDKTSAETVSKYKIGSFTDAQLTVQLQDDKKTVIITTATPITGTNLYVVNPIKLAADTNVETEIFTFVETYTDTVAPVITKVEYPTYDTAKITFSEPIKSLGSATANEGVSVPAITSGATSVTIDLTPATVDKDITVVFVGARDMADNLISPNPTTVTLKKVKSDTTKPAVAEVSILSDIKLSVKFTEKLKNAPVATVGGNAVVFTSEDNITWVGTFDQTTGVKVVAIEAGYLDMSGNAGDAYSTLKQITADTTKPTLVSSEIKTFSNKQYLVLTYSEDVDPATANVISGTKVKDYITTSFSGVSVAVKAYTKANGADADNAKAVMFELDDTNFTVGAYTLNIPANFVKDKASTPNLSDATSVSFTKGTLTVNDTSAPTVIANPSISSDNKKVTIKFSESLDYATALNIDNYRVSGQPIFTNAIFDGDDKTVTLTVASGSITYSGDRLITVTGVKDKAGNVNTSYSKILNFKENVAPYVASAKLTDANKITVTFSENVKATTDADFEVYVGGTKVAATTSVSGVPTNTAVITLADAITDLSKTIQVKLVNSAVVDVNDNPAVTGVLVTAQ
ncbi:hypothetical protein [Clostridium thermarum]|uniref:hypothetical protein n=1 Tax=Clostridium thermarum TaxID=1716543 RepID=UPI0013CF5B2E|nr:hypothetical protein [Clostridium thermarum]